MSDVSLNAVFTRQLPSIRRTLTADTATALVNALAVVICRIDYCNAVLTGVYGVHMRQLQGVLNAAACLIARKRKFISISSIRDVLHWLPIQHRYSTVCTASHPSTCRPCANKSLRISTDSLRSAARGDLTVPVTRTAHYGPHSFTVVGLSIWNSLLASRSSH